ncbi:hypothetical protein DRQ18_03770 [bacterium]|nr:MAG: hypothetical protein DRQ18_03770 [bacterium]
MRPSGFQDRGKGGNNKGVHVGVIVIEAEPGPVSVVGEGAIREVRLGIRLPEEPDDFLFQVKDTLLRYFKGEKVEFSFPLIIEGTELEQKVYKIVSRIPYGETRTYKEVAEQLGNPHLARFVGNTMKKNKIPILIPCHRVLRSDGTLGGFSGGTKWKRYLLSLEGAI